METPFKNFVVQKWACVAFSLDNTPSAVGTTFSLGTCMFRNVHFPSLLANLI